MNKFIKILSLILATLCIFTCFISCSKKDKEEQDTNKTPQNTTEVGNEEKTESNGKEYVYYVDNTFENSIKFSVSETLAKDCVPIVSSSFTEGYYKVTFAVQKDKTKLFTVYCTKNKDNIKEFEKEEDYEVLATDDLYTYIYFKYNTEKNIDENNKDIITLFNNEYKSIKSSLMVGK